MLHINRYYEDEKAFSFICVGLMALSCTGERAGDLVSQDFAFADQQLRYALTETENVRFLWVRRRKNYHLHVISSLTAPCDWFVPGTGVVAFSLVNFGICMNIQKMIFGKKKKAEFQTELLEPLKSYKGTHDLGFMLYCSYGNGYRMEQSDKYKQVLLGGKTLWPLVLTRWSVVFVPGIIMEINGNIRLL